MRVDRRWRADRLGALDSLAPVVLVLLAALLGGWFAPWLDDRSTGKTALDPDRYQLVVPGVKARGRSLADVAHSGLVDGVLILQTRDFGAAERLRTLVPVAELILELAHGSDPVTVAARTADGNQVQVVSFEVDGWRLPNGGEIHPFAVPGQARLIIHDGYAWADGARLGFAVPGTLELTPHDVVAIHRIQCLDAAGRVLMDDRFSSVTTPTRRGVWAVIAAMVAAAVLASTWTSRPSRRQIVGMGIALLLPFAVLATPYPAWTALVQALYLGGADVGNLRRSALVFATVPLLVACLLNSAILRLEAGRSWNPPARVEWLLAAGAALLACRDLSGWAWVLAPSSLLALLLPLRLIAAAGLPRGAAILRQVPAWLALAALGGETGLAGVLGWQALLLAVDARRLLHRGAAAGTDLALALLVLTPIAAEAALRATLVNRAWDPEVLAGASVGASQADTITIPFWSDSCGAAPAALYAFGGSSTGGAWQYRGEPTFFFPARLHTRLCAAGIAVRTMNFGEGGRDTFDFARGAERIFTDNGPPAVVVLYVGVNDLLTRESPLTRKEQATSVSARSTGLSLLDDLSSRSRLLIGIGLALRPRAAEALVQSVPLADAEENVRAIAAIVAARGGRLLLVPEITTGAGMVELAPYGEMLMRLGTQLPGTSSLAPRTALGAEVDAYLVDRNHLSPEGAEALAGVLVGPVTDALSPDRPR